MLKTSGCAYWFQNGLLKNSGPNRPRRRPWSRLGSRLPGLRQLGLQNSRPSQPASRPLRPPSNPQQWLLW